MNTENLNPEPKHLKTLFAIHGWSGVILGLLLYAVIVTGVIAVFAEEIGDWSNPLPSHHAEYFPADFDKALRTAATDIDPRFYDEVTVFPSSGGRIAAFFHTHSKIDGQVVDEGVKVYFDPSTQHEIARFSGTGQEINQLDQSNALAQFLINLHVRLYLPNPWGLLLTGILGLAMMVAAITGLIVHRKLLSELFVLRLSRKNPLLTARDRHVVAGSWNLLFAFLLAFTGSFFSFAGSFGLPAMAMVAFGGDQVKLIETVIGIPEAHDETPHDVANLDLILDDARSRMPDSHPASLAIMRWGRADALVQVAMSSPSEDLNGRSFLYDGASGEFMREKPFLGLTPSLGNSVLSLIGPLHFGNFGGFWSKIIWFSLGFASAYVVFTGLMLWTRRRRAQSPAWRKMASVTIWMGYGLPLAIAATLVGFFLAPVLDISANAGVKGSFLLAVVVATVLTIITVDLEQLRQRFLWGILGLLAITPLFRLGGGINWIDAIEQGWLVIPAMDLILWLCVALCVWQIMRLRLTSTTTNA